MFTHFKRRIGDEKGYTLLEGIIQLSVLTLFSQVFAVTIWWVYRVEENITSTVDTEWALFVQNVETYLNDIDTLVIQRGQPGIRFSKKEEEYDIELYSNIIRKQKNRLGHEQMLLSVESLSVTMEGQSLRFFVTFLNGVEKEYTFYVTYHSE